MFIDSAVGFYSKLYPCLIQLLNYYNTISHFGGTKYAHHMQQLLDMDKADMFSDAPRWRQ